MCDSRQICFESLKIIVRIYDRLGALLRTYFIGKIQAEVGE